MIDWNKMQTTEAKRAAYEAAIAARQAAYVSEFDPLKLEAEYDAVRGGKEPDYSLWLAKVAEIKSRCPLPGF